MSNENNEQIKKLQDDLAGNQSEEQMKDCQMKESVAQAGISNTASNPFTHIDDHNKAMNAYREKFGHDCDYNLTTKDIYALIYPNSTLIEETNSEFIPQPHEQRVIDERGDLAVKISDLYNFINGNEIFLKLSDYQKILLRKQLYHMQNYCELLDDRIADFSGRNWKPLVSRGEEIIGFFGTENDTVFNLKYVASHYIDATYTVGNCPRRNATVATDMEKTQMMAVKSLFTPSK